MKRQLSIAVVIFVIMTLMNVAGALVNERLKHDGTLADLTDTMQLIGIFCIFYLILTQVKVGIDDALKIPIARSVFWFCLALPDLWNDSIHTTGYVLYLIDSGLCLLWGAVNFMIWGWCAGCDFILQVIVLNVFLFAVYEFIIIKTSTLIADRFFFYPSQKIQP